VGVRAVILVHEDTGNQRRFWAAWASKQYQIPHLARFIHAADSRLAGGPGTGTVRRTSAVVAMLTGAISGALLLKSSLALPLALAAVLVLAAAIAYVPPRLRGEASATG